MSLRPRLLAAGLGGLAVLGFAPFGAFPLPILTLAGLFLLWRRQARYAMGLGFCYGLGFFLSGVSWIYVSLQHFGGMPMALAGLATLLFCSVIAIFPGLAGWLFAKLHRGQSSDLLLAAALWALADYSRSVILTGFPWLALGYAQSPPSPLAGYAPLVGVHGISLISSILAAALVLLQDYLLKRRARTTQAKYALAWPLVLLLGLPTIGFALHQIPWTQPKAKTIAVSLLQGNIEQSLKWRPELLNLSLNTYLKLAQEHPADLVVLPETALPLALEHIPLNYLGQLLTAARGENKAGALIMGVVSFNEAGQAVNAAAGIGAGRLQRYAKSHLVPFGEFIPPAFAWTLELLHIPMSDFARGAEIQPPLALAGEQIGVDICYEDAFGEEIIHTLPQASILLNLSNTAWFGDSLAQPQHLQIARMRALETGRPMLRATNTGMTAAISPKGQIMAVLPPFTSGALHVDVQGYQGATPYSRSGNWPTIVLGLLLAAISCRRRG